eukprot:GEZU01008554.1.p2 GENE.GEZU01008554.1~~GEZU01008554.1.p2  ORF type:complete len:120 (-),score=21.78 GEZU01008554.1:8-367(-)
MKKLQKKSSFFALQSADEAVPDMQVMRRPGSGINTADITSGSSSNNDSNSSSSSSAISTNPAASSPSVARVKTLRRMQSKYNVCNNQLVVSTISRVVLVVVPITHSFIIAITTATPLAD